MKYRKPVLIVFCLGIAVTVVAGGSWLLVLWKFEGTSQNEVFGEVKEFKVDGTTVFFTLPDFTRGWPIYVDHHNEQKEKRNFNLRISLENTGTKGFFVSIREITENTRREEFLDPGQKVVVFDEIDFLVFLREAGRYSHLKDSQDGTFSEWHQLLVLRNPEGSNIQGRIDLIPSRNISLDRPIKIYTEVPPLL